MPNATNAAPALLGDTAVPTGFRTRLVAWAAGFWGLVLFFPVGMNYLALLLLLLAVLVGGGLGQRVARVRNHALWWPVVVLLVVMALALVFQDKIYRETPSNLWHGGRIVLTLLLGLSLTGQEARVALMASAVSFATVLLLLAAFYLGVVPDQEWWRHLTHPGTNKSIAASIFFSLLAAVAWAIVLTSSGYRQATGLMVLGVAVVVIVLALGKRTAILGVLVAVLVIAFHQWRAKRLYLVASVLAVFVIAFSAYSAIPKLQAGLLKGVSEVQSALDGKVEQTSWNIRIQMIRHTSDMIAERPITGWGIGAWNEQWRARAPDILDSYNMPHNDLLWMGAQAGVPGAIAWLAVMLAAFWAGWRIPTWQGRAACAMAAVALFSSLVNNGTRDAEIGLPMLWLLGVALAYARATWQPNAASHQA
jgi:O-antigen ligase